MRLRVFQTGENAENEQKRRRILLLLVLLFAFVAISSCIVGYILGQRTEQKSSGRIIDTILLSPAQFQETMPLSLSGLVRYTDGTPCANKVLELHSQPRTTVSDGNGRFFFYNIAQGAHTVVVVGGDGQTLGSLTVTFDEGQSSARIYKSDGGYTLSVPADALLLEIDIVLDAATGAVTIDETTFCSVQTDGRVTTADGTVLAQDAHLVLTPGGATVLPDGTIRVPESGVILNDGTHIAPDGATVLPDGATVLPDGAVTTADGTQITPDSVVTLPDGATLLCGQAENLPEGVTVAPDGTLTLPDGTAVSADGTVTLPGGTQVSPEHTVTLPGGTLLNITDESVTLPNGITVDLRGGGISLTDGTTVLGNTVITPDGIVIDNQNQTITNAGGAVIDGNGVVTLPDGSVIDPGKPGRLPDGTVVGSDGTITLPDGTTVHPNGTVTAPDGTDITAPTGGAYVLDGEAAYPIGEDTHSQSPDSPADPGAATNTDPPVQTNPPVQTDPPQRTPRSNLDPPNPPPVSTPTPTPTSTMFGVTYRWDQTYSFAGLLSLPSDTRMYAVGAAVTVAANCADVAVTGGKWIFDGWRLGGAAVGATVAMQSGGLALTGSWTFLEDLDGMIEVKSEGGATTWTQNTVIALFASSDSTVTGKKLYPGVTGSYDFSVKNPQAYDVSFVMEISETQASGGPQPIPFEYRLRIRDGAYIAGTGGTDIGWRTAAQLMDVAVTLDSTKEVSYTLEWRWPYESGNDARDTAIGTHVTKAHTINVTIRAEQIV